MQWLRSTPAPAIRSSPRSCSIALLVYVASSGTTARKPSSSRPTADCATHTSVSNPTSTTVPRPVARIASTASAWAASPNVGLTTIGVSSGSRSRIPGSVWPLRSGPSSTTTAGMSSSDAIPAIHVMRATAFDARMASPSPSAS